MALLRGINVGGRNKIPMKDLREVVAALGHTDVATYIQSGNIVLTSTVTSEATLTAGLERAITEAFGLKIAVVVRSHHELVDVLAHNPYSKEADADGAKVFVTFLAKKPSAAAVHKLDPERSPPDVFTVRGREVYLYCPDGIGRSKLTSDFFKPVGIEATARNVNTVRRLVEMSAP